MLIGSVLASTVMVKLLGRDNWLKLRGYLVAGEMCGEGLTLLIGAAVSLIFKSG